MPLSNGVCYRDYFNLPQTTPKVSLPLPDLGNQVEEQGARIERELQQLRSDPAAFKGRDVYQRWIEDHVDHGVVHRHVCGRCLPWQAPQKIVMVPPPSLVCPPPPLPCIGTMAIAGPRPRGGQ